MIARVLPSPRVILKHLCWILLVLFLSHFFLPQDGQKASFPLPKKGLKRMILKRPAGKKTSAWKRTPYQKPVDGHAYTRKEQVKWRRSLQELLAASDDDILHILKADKLLPEWKDAVCPRCNEGRLGALLTRPSGGLAHRCSRKHCQQYITPLELHRLFAKTMGMEGHSIQVQAAALLLRLVNVPLSNIHLLTKINHKSIERLSRNLLLLRKGHVQEAEKVIKFGGAGRAWKDVEVDEATFDKRTPNPEELTVDQKAKGKNTRWEQWGGIIQRGDPKTLVLSKLKPPLTVPRAPGPGAMRKVDWGPLAKTWLEGRNVVLHSDSARSYKMKIAGVVHDAVVHAKKRVRRNGKYVWAKPTFVKLASHKLPDGRRIKSKAGTQIVDRAWRFIKERLQRNQHAKSASVMLAAQAPHRSEVPSMSTGTERRTCGCVQERWLRST